MIFVSSESVSPVFAKRGEKRKREKQVNIIFMIIFIVYKNLKISLV